jgi:hypothetical protein
MDDERFSFWCPSPSGLEETFPNVDRRCWDDWQSIAIVLQRPVTAPRNPTLGRVETAEKAPPAPEDARETGEACRAPTSGFAALVDREQNLRRLMQLCVDRAAGSQAENTVRILSRHRTQIDAIIALLIRRWAHFPQPARCGAAAAVDPRGTHHHPAAGWEGGSAIASLHARHLELLGNLGSWIKDMEPVAGREGLLREAWQRHEEMAWMLDALLIEEDHVARRHSFYLTIPMQLETRSPAMERWENEGGRTSGVSPPLGVAA